VSSFFLGQEVTFNDENGVSKVTQQHGHGGGGGGGTGGGTPTGGTPSGTIVGTSGHLQIDLVWDSSVANAPSGFTTAVTDAATYIASQYSTPEMIYIHVGWGEMNGQTMMAGALGESSSNGYLTNFATATASLTKLGYTFTANNEPMAAQFFITSAQAKESGLTNAYSTGTDGYIGFGSGFNWNFSATTGAAGTGTGSGQYDLQSVAQHEITEVMGRIEMQGQSINGAATYTALDLFNFSSPGHLELSGGGGYFSVDNGNTNLGWFNNASAHGGDIADWSSSPGTVGLQSGYQDSFDAFGYSGINGEMTQTDLQIIGALGFGGSMYLV
jgi:hypothetical protein